MEPTECDLIVSLGHNCAMAYNLRDFYGVEETGLLDWNITPPACLPDLIRRRFALVDDAFEASLSLVDAGGKESIRHDPTGVLLFHAFTRSANDRAVTPLWRSEIDKVAEKLAFLGERMDRRLSEARAPALFLYSGSARIEAGAIIDALDETYPAAEPVLCGLRDPGAEGLGGFPRLRSAVVGNRGDWHEGEDGHWAGCRTGWQEALRSVNVWLSALRGSRTLARYAGRSR